MVLLIAYAAVHQSATLSVASLQLNIPMAVYVVWSVYRANTLLKRAKNAESQIEADASNSVPQSAQEKRVNA